MSADTKEKTNGGSARLPRLRYEQARQAVEQCIRDKDLKPGDRLPTEEALRREFGWSRVTITRALNELAWEGKLTRIQGSGTYVSSPQEAQRTPRIMVSAPPFEYQDDDYCNPLFAGLREEAAAQNVNVVYYTQAAVPDLETVREMNVDGVVSLSWVADDLRPVLTLHEAGIPIVGLALRSRSHTLPLVCVDNFGGVCQAVEHLLAHGHRRIAYTSTSLQNSDVQERLAGFQYAMARAGLAVDPAYLQISAGRCDVPFLEAWWQSMTPRPTALLLHGTAAPAALTALHRQGVHIPQDLSVIVIDDVQAVQHHLPALTALKQSPYDLGRRGLAKLIAMLRGEDQGRPEILATQLINRDSVVAPPQPDALHASAPHLQAMSTNAPQSNLPVHALV